MSLEHSILCSYGGVDKNNLLKVLIQNDIDNIDSSVVFSPYYTPDTAVTVLSEYSDSFTILTLNCQSLNAKFDELMLLIHRLEENHFEFSAICLQETWLREDSDLSMYLINNYHCISQGKSCSEHGGLLIYLHSDYNYELYTLPNKPLIWECLFIKICSNINSKHIYLGNIYRPPKDNYSRVNMQQFIDEFSHILSELNKSRSTIIITGDFNLDLLKMHKTAIVREFFEISFGLLPSLSLPTRISTNSATLMDNIFTNHAHGLHSSGILISEISDHFPCFYQVSLSYEHNSLKKYIFKRNFNQQNIDCMYRDLESRNIIELLIPDKQTDPNINYNTLENILRNAVNKYIPLKKVKFNKYKHKRTRWITFGILKSIKFRDNLFKCLKQTLPNTLNYQNIKNNLTTYNRILKKLIRAAKANYYHSKFEQCKSDPKKTWQNINEVINRSHSKNIPDHLIINHNKVTDKKTIADHFNNYFTEIGRNMEASIKKIDKKYYTYLTKEQSSTFSFKNIEENDLNDIIKQLNPKSS